jgi:hypothetical protein
MSQGWRGGFHPHYNGIQIFGAIANHRSSQWQNRRSSLWVASGARATLEGYACSIMQECFFVVLS